MFDIFFHSVLCTAEESDRFCGVFVIAYVLRSIGSQTTQQQQQQHHNQNGYKNIITIIMVMFMYSRKYSEEKEGNGIHAQANLCCCNTTSTQHNRVYTGKISCYFLFVSMCINHMLACFDAHTHTSSGTQHAHLFTNTKSTHTQLPSHEQHTSECCELIFFEGFC